MLSQDLSGGIYIDAGPNLVQIARSRKMTESLLQRLLFYLTPIPGMDLNRRCQLFHHYITTVYGHLSLAKWVRRIFYDSFLLKWPSPEPMSESKNASPSPSPADRPNGGSSATPLALLKISAFALVALAIVLYQLDSFDPAALPAHELTRDVAAVPECNGRMLEGAEYVGLGKLSAPEDIAYESSSGLVYTGDADGWVKRVRLNDSVVERWAFTGGRPLGIALGLNGEVIVADADKGLLKVTEEGVVEPLAEEAGGLKFKLTDGVDVAHDGTIYFTDASSKYSFHHFIFDILEAKPLGRFMSYDPATKLTKILLSDLYFANGVAVAPTQDFVIYCETPLRRCRKYYIAGDRKGSVEKFVDNLPGMPDNIRYDGDGHYWIGLSTEMTNSWYLALRYPVIRKVLAMMEKYGGGRPRFEKNGGVVAVNLEGKPVAWYYDHGLSMVTTGMKIGNHLYCGSLVVSAIIRLNLNEYPARTSGCRPSNSDL